MRFVGNEGLHHVIKNAFIVNIFTMCIEINYALMKHSSLVNFANVDDSYVVFNSEK